jgi:hypothetical protein
MNPRRVIVPILLVALGIWAGPCAAADPGRLFYTPAQRAQLEAARSRNVTQVKPAASESESVSAPPPPVHFDGMVIRSDGQTTRWVDGKAQVGPSSVADLKPGQIRAGGKVYEPYQVLRPTPSSPAAPVNKESAP